MSREAITVVREWIEDMQRQFYEHAKKLPDEISCFTCDRHGCCKQKVGVDVGEALMIAEYIQRENPGLTGDYMTAYIGSMNAEADLMDEHSRDDWFNLNRPCVFLKDGRCTIYEVRPLACRIHLVVSPPEDCELPSNKPILKVDARKVEQEHFFFSRHIHGQLNLKESNFRSYIDFLPRMVARVLEASREADNTRDFAKRMRKFKWPTAMEIVEAKKAKWR